MFHWRVGDGVDAMVSLSMSAFNWTCGQSTPPAARARPITSVKTKAGVWRSSLIRHLVHRLVSAYATNGRIAGTRDVISRDVTRDVIGGVPRRPG